MTKQQFIEISKWQKDTFGQATPISKIAHLAEELQELVNDLKNNNPDRRLEYADCFFLLFGSAAADGMSYEDICNAIDEKFEINKNRKWGKPDENGVVKHIEKENQSLKVFTNNGEEVLFFENTHTTKQIKGRIVTCFYKGIIHPNYFSWNHDRNQLYGLTHRFFWDEYGHFYDSSQPWLDINISKLKPNQP